jgi:hypothetical protein
MLSIVPFQCEEPLLTIVPIQCSFHFCLGLMLSPLASLN